MSKLIRLKKLATYFYLLVVVNDDDDGDRQRQQWPQYFMLHTHPPDHPRLQMTTHLQEHLLVHPLMCSIHRSVAKEAGETAVYCRQLFDELMHNICR